MASTFENLPPEMVQKCLEFLPFDELIEVWDDSDDEDDDDD